jgi:AGZA family xanthine/uracil permease-like MFS transporter
VTWQALLLLGNGFILTAVLWGWAMVAIIDRRLGIAGALFAVASAMTLVGLIHSPLPTGGVFWPWPPPSPVVSRVAGAYGVLASICVLVAIGSGGRDPRAPGTREPAHPPRAFSVEEIASPRE